MPLARLAAKRFVFTMLLLFSVTAATDDLTCPINEEIAEDIRISDAEFNQANAEAALARLETIVREGRRSADWPEVPNALKIIEG